MPASSTAATATTEARDTAAIAGWCVVAHMGVTERHDVTLFRALGTFPPPRSPKGRVRWFPGLSRSRWLMEE